MGNKGGSKSASRKFKKSGKTRKIAAATASAAASAAASAEKVFSREKVIVVQKGIAALAPPCVILASLVVEKCPPCSCPQMSPALIATDSFWFGGWGVNGLPLCTAPGEFFDYLCHGDGMTKDGAVKPFFGSPFDHYRLLQGISVSR